MSHTSRAVLVLAAAVAVTTTTVADAGAASGGTWSVLYEQPAPSAYFASISGSDAHNAWAVGAGGYVNGRHLPPQLAQWDGTRWTRAAAPAIATRASGLDFSQVKAVTKDDTWAIGSANVGSAPAGVIAHRTGGHWTTRVLPARSTVNHISVFSADNVWILGSLNDSNNNPVHPTAWHWNGRTWTSGKLPAVSTGRSDDAYYDTATVPDTSVPKEVRSRGVLLRYSAGRWVVATGPHITPPKGTGGIPNEFRFIGVVRRSASDVDVAVNYYESQDPQGIIDVFHWNGTSWTRSTRVATGFPDEASEAGQICGDGNGGLWMLSVSHKGEGLIDIRHGKIVARTIYTNAGEFGVSDLTLRPGTRRVWLAGGDYTGSSKTEVSKIVGYVP